MSLEQTGEIDEDDRCGQCATAGTAGRQVIVCGAPNVGKSVIFGRLTGTYVTVSNYPGTTVEVTRAPSPLIDGLEVMDTPGAYSLFPISEEERVTRDILLDVGDGALVLHVADAKNLRRMLPMTVELMELGLRVVLVLNMMDEARRVGVLIDAQRLGSLLGIPVVKTVAATGEGIAELTHAIVRDAAEVRDPAVDYADLDPRALVTAATPPDAQTELLLRRCRQEHVDKILSECAVFPPVSAGAFASALNHLTINIATAAPIALAVLYFGVYLFVGKFGAGTLVDFLENGVYDRFVTPYLTAWTERLLPWRTAQDLFVHEYGMLTLGLRYAFALILPIVGTFFLLFSTLEDSGYLPRLALLLDRVFKLIGLNGRAVIPIILGFGCGTMATMVTRILETRRERIIATLLLGAAIPCSAQLGVILAMLAGKPAAFAAWCATMAAIFLLLGMLAAHRLPGDKPHFYLEIPPLRVPRPGNVVVKTYSRMYWYFVEILPLFLAASVLIWLGHVTNVFHFVTGLLEPAVAAMGLPPESAQSFLFGFFRRDYGAAGLFDLQRAGLLDARQSFVSVMVITLFLPCVAQFLVMKKERGWRFTLLTSAAILVTAFTIGVASNQIILRLGLMR